MTGRATRFTAVFERELRSLVRTRSTWALGLGFVALTLGIGILSGTGGYVLLSLALLTPLELIVPVLAAATGYRAVLGDRERDELSVLRTYPLDASTYVGGVYAGRLVGLLVTIVGSLLIAGIVVPVIDPSPASLTRTSGLDAPLYYLRFVVLTAAFGAVTLALMVLISAVAGTSRRGVVGAVIAVVVVSVGMDLAIVLGLATDVVGGGSLAGLLALSPASAYRGLVMRYVLGPVVTTAVRPAAPLISALGLGAWLLSSLTVAAWRAWSPATYVRHEDE